uniref:snaclec rhodocetin subunit delta-like n=1 Tax=Styela clava TaxID=7725 RepID=UPI0019398EF4|nr:snaclec rhodocetin subunit delta-like [Styela clava]
MWFLLIWISLFNLTQAKTPTRTSDFRNYRLELFTEKKSYDAAKTVCERRNAWLVEIKDEETQAAVSRLTEYNIWIGLHHDSGWRWNNINKLHYTNWFVRPYFFTLPICILETNIKYVTLKLNIIFVVESYYNIGVY